MISALASWSGDHAMTKDTTKEAAAAAEGLLFDDLVRRDRGRGPRSGARLYRDDATLRLDVVGGFEQKDIEALATTSNEMAKAWADGGIKPMDFTAWTLAANLDYEKARRYRNKVRDEHKIDIGVPRARPALMSVDDLENKRLPWNA